MAEGERGSTLVEIAVVAGIVALLLAAGGFLLLGMRPGALVHASSDFDAAFAAARAIASASGNGATIVFAPRSGAPNAGFVLRVYAGRPSGARTVRPTTVMPLVSDATVSETSLGRPPFAIFLGAFGDVSGAAGYPSIAASGKTTFPTIAVEPACPSAGYTLTFTAPQGATATRSISCSASVAAAAPPNPSPTPNVPTATPALVVFHWPADAQQSFAATEWGYTHWFVSASGFRCGNGIARYPNVLPSPYSPAYSPAEAQADPQPPPRTPYSYPNSGGGSTNDAPAMFPLIPANQGVCHATVADEYGQPAISTVQVMGWLTAAYHTATATHLTPPLPLSGAAFPSKGASATIALSKTFDAEPLRPQVALDPICSAYLKFAVTSGTTPPSPSTNPATAAVTLTAFAMPASKIACGATMYDQYANSRSGEGVAVNATLDPEKPLVAWPPAEEVALAGQNLGTASDGTSCYARAFTDDSFTTPIRRSVELAADGTTIVAQTDASGCLFGAGAQAPVPLSGGAVAAEPGMPASRSFTYEGCAEKVVFAAHWTPTNAGPGADLIPFTGRRTGSCTVHVAGDITADPRATPAPVALVIDGCTAAGGTVEVGGSCRYAMPANVTQGQCSKSPPGDGGDLQTWTYVATFNPELPTGGDPPPTGTSPYGTLSQSGENVATFMRTAPGSVSVYIDELYWQAAGSLCTASGRLTRVATLSYT